MSNKSNFEKHIENMILANCQNAIHKYENTVCNEFKEFLKREGIVDKFLLEINGGKVEKEILERRNWI